MDRVTHYNREMLTQLEPKLRSEGYEIHLFSGEVPEGATGRVGIKSRTIHNETKYRYREWRVGSYIFREQIGLKRKIAMLKPDLVVMGCFPGSMAIWRWLSLKKKVGYKAVSWLCGYEFNPGRIKDMFLRKFIPMFDYHLAYHSNAEKYALAYGAHARHITIIHNTINESGIKSLPKGDAREYIQSIYPAIDGKKVLLYVGAVLKEKRLPVIFKALDRLNRKNLVFVLVGDGPYMPEIRRQCQGREDVILTGKIIDGVGPYFDAADCFVLPGTGGLAINEAMAHGLPIVSGYADGSADDLVQNGKNGYRLYDNTSAEIAEKISAVLDDPGKALRFGEKSRALITGRLSFDRFIDRICDGICKADAII